MPDEPNRPYDMRDIIYRIVDDEEFMEVQGSYALGGVGAGPTQL